MRGVPRAVLFGLVLVVTVLSVPPAFPPRAGASFVHAPISIVGNAGFTAANGVVRGVGTPSDPYVIEGWHINASEGPGIGIGIRDTDAHFAIRGVRVNAEFLVPSGIGAEFRNVSNGRVENSSFSGGFGLIVQSSAGVQLRGNGISAYSWAVWINASRDVLVAGNSALAGEHAVFVTESGNATIHENRLESGLWTVVLGASTGVGVFHNNIFYESASWAAVDYDANAWDDGYPSGGNYWSRYRAVDLCSGPDQDVCPDPDGIADKPFNLTGGQDRYPLMVPYPVPPPDRPPEAPIMRPAVLTGPGMEDVTLSWSLSADDGGGEGDVVGYELWAGDAYDPSGSAYARFAVLPPGSTSYVDAGAGAGGPAHRYYQVVARDDAGHSTVAVDQAGKWSQPLAAGSHLLSVPLEQSDWRVESVLRSVPWTRVWSYPNTGDSTWLSNVREKSSASLTTLNRTVGFWADTSADAVWAIAGLVPRTTQIVLGTGWNLIGYPKLVSCPRDSVLGPEGNPTAERFADLPPYFLMTMGPFDPFNPGGGYWVLVPGAGSVLTLTN